MITELQWRLLSAQDRKNLCVVFRELEVFVESGRLTFDFDIVFTDVSTIDQYWSLFTSR